jgi:ubiquinone/menaquinone biosynthesis C-methylase UbiE
MVTNRKVLSRVKDFFDGRADSFRRVSRWAEDETLNLKTDEFLIGLSGRIALDLGAGIGTLTSRIRGFEIKIALDISARMLSHLKDVTVQKLVSDIHHLSLPEGEIDLIICRQVLHYCNLKSSFREIIRVLKREGYLHIVQVVDFENVPDSWDQEWARFRNVESRRHLRRKELEECFSENAVHVIKSEFMVLRDQYSWEDFFIKNSIGKGREDEVKQFFHTTPANIVNDIDLQIDAQGIAYNRLFGFWLLQKS